MQLVLGGVGHAELLDMAKSCFGGVTTAACCKGDKLICSRRILLWPMCEPSQILWLLLWQLDRAESWSVPFGAELMQGTLGMTLFERPCAFLDSGVVPRGLPLLMQN